jgi:hypothetical protein
MDLAQNFEGVACDKTISVTELDPDRKYRIIRAKRLTTIFGPTVVLTIQDSMQASAQVFLPRRYSDVVTDTDIEQINSNTVFLHLVYRGVFNNESLPVSDKDITHICFHFIKVHLVGMRPLGKVFDGSSSLFETQRVLYNFIGHAIWLGQFTPVRRDHLHFFRHYFRCFDQ